MAQEKGPRRFAYSSPLQIPPELQYLVCAVQQSGELLQLPSTFDGQGSNPPTEATLVRANDFLLKNAAAIYNAEGIAIQAPIITVAADRSVDMHWSNGPQELLVNIPVDLSEPVSFCGGENGTEKVTGLLPITQPAIEIFHWLKPVTR